MDFSSAAVSILAVGLYIVETYFDLGSLARVLELLFSCFFVLEYGLRIYIAEYKWLYVWSWESAVDVLTILPPFLELPLKHGAPVNFTFLRFARLLRLLRILRVHRLMARTDSLIQRKVMVLCFSMLTLVICSAGAFIEAEHEQVRSPLVKSYLKAVTIATVGYGDIKPETTQGKFIVIFTILLVVTVLPHQTNELITLLTQRSYYERASYPGPAAGRHIVMAGSIGAVAFMDFMEEFYHKDHGFEDREIVILSPTPLERNLETVDVVRTAAKNATAIFILCDKHSVQPQQEDETNLLIALSFSQYLRGERFLDAAQVPRIMIEILSPDSRAHLASFVEGPSRPLMENESLADGEATIKPYFSVLCILELKLAMMAQSCLGCPGLITLICNLCRSVSSELATQVAPLPSYPLRRPQVSGAEWKQEYLRGASMEIYRTPLSPMFIGKSYRGVADLIYSKHGAILVGIEKSASSRELLRAGSFVKTTSPHDASSVDFSQLLLATTDYILTDVSQTVGFVIAPNLETCLEIAAYDMPALTLPKTLTGNQRLTHFRNAPIEAGMHSKKLQRWSTHKWETSLAEQLSKSAQGELDEEATGEPIGEGVEEGAVSESGSQPGTWRRGTWLRKPSSPQGRFTVYLSRLNRSHSLDGLHAMRQGSAHSEASLSAEGGCADANSSKFPFSTARYGLSYFENAAEEASTSEQGPIRGRLMWQNLRLANEAGLLSPPKQPPSNNMICSTVQKAIYLKQHYHVYRSPWSLQEATIYEVDFKGHIVIFGIASVQSLFHLIAPLRLKTLKKVTSIVLVDCSPLDPRKWTEISMFQAVYFFQGSARSPSDLRRLKIPFATKAVILPNRQRPVMDVYHEARLDADVVLTYNQLISLNPELEIFMDVSAANNLAFLMPGLKQGTGSTASFIASPFFAAGMVFLSGFMDTLFCQAFYNSDIIRIIRKILVGNDMADTSQNRESTSLATSAHKRSVHLTTISVPQQFVGASFGALFSHELQQGYVCLGIYRKRRGYRGNTAPYVYTNPPAHLTLEARCSYLWR